MFKFNEIFNKQPKATQEEMSLVTVMPAPGISESQLFSSIKDGDEINFVLTRYNIYISNSSNENLLEKLHIKKEDCLISNGVFMVDSASKKLKIGHHLNEGKAEPHIERTAENKIMEFLKNHGIETEHPVPIY